MAAHIFWVLAPVALDIIQQNKDKTLFRKNISPRFLFLAFVFNLYLFSLWGISTGSSNYILIIHS